jgi:hypothetical protein
VGLHHDEGGGGPAGRPDRGNQLSGRSAAAGLSTRTVIAYPGLGTAMV